MTFGALNQHAMSGSYCQTKPNQRININIKLTTNYYIIRSKIKRV